MTTKYICLYMYLCVHMGVVNIYLNILNTQLEHN